MSDGADRYIWEHGQEYDPPTPEEMEIDFADTVGGMEGGQAKNVPFEQVSLELLRSDNPAVRHAFIMGYWRAFLIRKVDDGEISESEYQFYDPYPGRWGTYWQEPPDVPERPESPSNADFGQWIDASSLEDLPF